MFVCENFSGLVLFAALTVLRFFDFPLALEGVEDFGFAYCIGKREVGEAECCFPRNIRQQKYSRKGEIAKRKRDRQQ